MSRSERKSRGWKGGAVGVGLASTLIIAFAIAKPSFQLPKQNSEAHIAGPINGTVKRLEVRIGERIVQGENLLVLSDPGLEQQIQEAELALEQARASDLTAVAEPGMLGSIGSVTRTIWETPQVESHSPTKAIARTEPGQVPDTISPKIAEAKTKIANLEHLIASKETSLQDAEANLAASQSAIQDAEDRSSSIAKDRDRHQRLYDIGAIAKRKLDDVLSAATQAEVEVKAAIATAEDRKVQRDQVQKDLLDAKAELNKERIGLDSLQNQAVRVTQAPAEIENESRSGPARVLPRRRIAFGTSPESLAPITVKLVDSGDSAKDATIAALMEKVQTLRTQRERGILKSPVNGRITWIAPVGTQLKAGEVAVRIEQLSQ